MSVYDYRLSTIRKYLIEITEEVNWLLDNERTGKLLLSNDDCITIFHDLLTSLIFEKFPRWIEEHGEGYDAITKHSKIPFEIKVSICNKGRWSSGFGAKVKDLLIIDLLIENDRIVGIFASAMKQTKKSYFKTSTRGDKSFKIHKDDIEHKDMKMLLGNLVPKLVNAHPTHKLIMGL